MVLDNLAVSITSQVTDVQQGIRSVRGSFVDLARTSRGTSSSLDETADELTDVSASSVSTSAALAILANRLDSVDDELDDTRNSAAFASGAVTSFGVSTEGASLGVTSLSGSLTAALIPALALLATTLAPILAIVGTAATAVGALAGAFGLVIGSGVIAGFNRLKNTLQESLGLIEAQLTGFGQAAVPVLDDILAQLPGLVRDILSAFGGTDTFLDALSSGFQTLRDVAPAAIRTLRDLAAEALPVVSDLINFLIENGPSIFREMVQTTRDLAPQILAFTDAVIEASPALLRFGTFVFETVVPALTQLIDRTRPLIEGFLVVLAIFRELDSQLRTTAPFISEGLAQAFKVLLDPIQAVRDSITELLELWGVVEDTGFGQAIQDALDVVRGGMGGEFVQRGVMAQTQPRAPPRDLRLSGDLEVGDNGEIIAKFREEAQNTFNTQQLRDADRADRLRPQ